MSNRIFSDVEQLALLAHRAGERWSTFWPQVAGDVAQLEPYHHGRYRKLVERLLSLVVAGDLDGVEPIGLSPWEQT
jgi:hypothetical protein